jgi:hypothetical protein
MQIYLFINGEQVGPYSAEQIQAMLASGAVTPETMAWYEGLPEWTPVTQVVQPAAAAVGGPGDIVIEGGPPQLAGGAGDVVLNITHQETYSRGQLLLRTFLGIFYLILPHAICLWLLGIAINFCTLIAWFAILFTGQYPAGIYSFVVSVHQWSVRWMARVSNLMDGYPAFGMGNQGDGVTLEITRPAISSRLHCVLRIFSGIYVGVPHVICLFFRQIIGGVLGVVAWFAVLFTGKYPKGMHGFQVGNIRWGLRVMAYITMLSDRYPPFSGKP